MRCLPKRGALDGAHVTVRGGEAYLINSEIPPFQPRNMPEDYDPRRNRRLLLTKKELTQLAGMESRKGLTIVPVSVYTKGRKLKIKIAVVRGKKKHDKREKIKKKDFERRKKRLINI